MGWLAYNAESNYLVAEISAAAETIYAHDNRARRAVSTRRAISLSGLGVPASVKAEAIADVRPDEVLVFTTTDKDPPRDMIQALAACVMDAWPKNKAILLSGDLRLDLLTFGRRP
jgi:hypothetical protein